jgi:LacI family transcriptional regulator
MTATEPMNTPGRPTLADVAARAGVSLKTASRALNGEYGVAESTARRVLEASRELGFRPNHLARSLAGGGPSAAVGLLLPNVSDPFIAAVVGAVEEVISPRDLQLITASHGDDSDRQRKLVRALVERRVDALVVVPAPGDCSYLRHEIDHGLVVVALDRPLEGLDVDTATVDNIDGARQAVRRLLDAGHHRVALLGTDGRLWTLQRRYEGYVAALAEAGIAVDPALVDLDAGEASGAERVMAMLLELPDPPTAVFAAQNMAGRGAMRAVRNRGVDLQLAIFDEMVDTDLLVTPPLVVAASGPDRLGRLAARMTLERLDRLQGPPRHVELPALLLGPGERYVPRPQTERLGVGV